MTLAAITTLPKTTHNTSTLNTGETSSNYSVKLSLSPHKSSYGTFLDSLTVDWFKIPDVNQRLKRRHIWRHGKSSQLYIYNIKSHNRTAVLLWLLIIYIVIKAKNASEVLNYNSIILFITPEKLSIQESCSNRFRMYIMLCTLYYLFIVRKLSLLKAEPLDNLELWLA